MMTQNYDTESKSKEQLLEDIEEFDGWLSGYKSLIQESAIEPAGPYMSNERAVALEVVETIQQELFLRVLRE